ncbi:MAG TPA: VOC family protein [Draconibacterium sp.]|nr:VOC family protein [Draconibacterium sp.]
MKPRLNIVTLGVKDLNESKKFYSEALNWQPAGPGDDNIVFYNQLGIILALYPTEKLAEDAGLPAERNGFSGVTLAINLDSINAVDNLVAKVKTAGGKILIQPRETFWGGYDAYFADPDGHSWEIAWAPFWEYDEQGSLKL